MQVTLSTAVFALAVVVFQEKCGDRWRLRWFTSIALPDRILVRATGLAPVSASDSAAVLKTAVFAFHHARANASKGADLTAPLSRAVVVHGFTSCLLPFRPQRS